MYGFKDVGKLAEALIAGDRIALSKAITLVESTKPEHLDLASELIAACAGRSNASQRIGITGIPGVGKSTFIDELGTRLTKVGRRVVVLAVDPSSDISKGSILGDKTRMDRLSTDSNAFIRPTPASGTLGGVARKTRETIVLCEAAGFDSILVETVGVGQSETAVSSMVDMFLLLVLGNAGDELQGIKRGIMELADAIIINKDDGENASHTKIAKAAYVQALHMFPAKENGWTVPVLACSSHTGNGVDGVMKSMENYFELTSSNGYFVQKRSHQNLFWLQQALKDEFERRFHANAGNAKALKMMENEVLAGTISPFAAARQLLNDWDYKS